MVEADLRVHLSSQTGEAARGRLTPRLAWRQRWPKLRANAAMGRRGKMAASRQTRGAAKKRAAPVKLPRPASAASSPCRTSSASASHCCRCAPPRTAPGHAPRLADGAARPPRPDGQGGGAGRGRDRPGVLPRAAGRRGGPREDGLAAALDQLTGAGLVFRRGAAGAEAGYLFKHALVRDAAYGTLLRDRRRRLHAAVARALEERFPEARAEFERIDALYNPERDRVLAARCVTEPGASGCHSRRCRRMAPMNPRNTGLRPAG